MASTFAVPEDRQDSAITAVFARVEDALFGLVRWMIAARARARTRRILSSLDDAALKDIGLTRGQIDAVERDPRYTPRFPGF
jgi:uncharacterized protein YjiS (DUF1127 family)